MTSSEAFQYLHSLRQFGFQPGLETTRRLVAAAGNPQEKLSFIHVAGTNGKGSVCALLDSVYRRSGRTVGLYTSPHLVRFGERIQVNREPLDDHTLARHVAEARDLLAGLEGLEPTFFEFTTLLALRHFTEQRVDVVIWETGLGGRLDATNIVTPLASVITNIALDHVEVLGNSLAAIAAEKAGIIKPGVPIVTAETDTEAEAILRFKARELDAPYLPVGSAEVASFHLEVGLAGRHQRVNGALAATTVRLLRALLPVSDEQLRQGLAEAAWPGRLQVVEQGRRKLILDGAHNLAGIRALAAALPEILGTIRPTVIVGLLADKDAPGMLRELMSLAGRVVTAPVSNARAVSAEALRATAVATGLGRPVKAADSLAEALKLTAADPCVLVTGSLYFVGEALELLGLATGAGAGERELNEWSVVRGI